MMRSLGNNGINIIAIEPGSSERTISVVINKEDENKALNALHEGFFLSDVKVINLFVIGTGLIGSTLIKQIEEQSPSLLQDRGVEIRLIGVANSRKMLFDEQGIDLSGWKERLSEKGEKMNIFHFIRSWISTSAFYPMTTWMVPDARRFFLGYYPRGRLLLRQ